MANYFPLIANQSITGNRIEELPITANLDLANSGIVNLDVGNFHLGGGNFGQVLTTDGTGNLAWANGGTGGATPQPQIEFTVGANANNQTFTKANIAVFADNTYAAVFVNGVLIPTADYSIVGNVLTIDTWLNTGDAVAIGPFGGGGVGSGTVSNVDTNTTAGSNTTASTLGFALTGGPITSTGVVSLTVPSVAQFRTNANIGTVANINLNNTAGTYLSGTGVWSTPPMLAAGSNTQVQYNNNGTLAGSNNFTFNGNTVSTINVFERTATTAGLMDLSQAAYFTASLTGNTTFSVSNVPAAPQVGSFILHMSNTVSKTLTYNFGGNVKWAGGIAPLLSSNTTTSDSVGFYTLDGGLNWYGYLLGKDM